MLNLVVILCRLSEQSVSITEPVTEDDGQGSQDPVKKPLTSGPTGGSGAHPRAMLARNGPRGRINKEDSFLVRAASLARQSAVCL